MEASKLGNIKILGLKCVPVNMKTRPNNPLKETLEAFNSRFLASKMPCQIDSSTWELSLHKPPLYKCLIPTGVFSLVTVISAAFALKKMTNSLNLSDIASLEIELVLPLLISVVICGAPSVGLLINALYLYWGSEYVFAWNNLLAVRDRLYKSKGVKFILKLRNLYLLLNTYKFYDKSDVKMYVRFAKNKK